MPAAPMPRTQSPAEEEDRTMRGLWHDGRALRAILGLGLAAFALLQAPAAARATAKYEFVYVDAFQGSYDLREAYLYDINDFGQACGMATDLPSYSGYAWSLKDEKSRLPFTLARGINDAGKIAGLDRVFDPATGEVTVIPHVAGAPASPVALDINDHDIVVGYAETCICSNSNRVLQIPFVWDPVRGSRPVLVPGAKELVKVNNHDVAVGIIRGGPHDGFVYDIATGQATVLGPFLPPNTYPWIEAADINDLGVVTGKHRGNDFSTFDGFTWSAAAGATLLPHFPGNPALDVIPWAINDAGVVVGMAEVADHTWHAFSWDPANGLVDLNDVVTVPAGFILDRALEINDAGWIVGDGHFGPNWSSSQAFVLIPRGIVLAAPGTGTPLDVRVVPNPTFGATRLEFAAAAPGIAKVSIHDLRGRLVAHFVAPVSTSGTGVATWDGRDRAGRALPAGAYVVRVEINGTSVTRKVALLR
jgi:probable HAF family extracellular repeat protein